MLNLISSEEVLPNTFQTFSIFIAELDESMPSFIIGKYTRQYLIAEYKIYLDYNPNQPSTVDLFSSIQAPATPAVSFFSTETA